MLGVATSARSLWRWAALVSVAIGAVLAPFSVAGASPGYEVDSVQPSIATSGELPLGIAIDQVNQDIYVAELSTNKSSAAHGLVEQFDADGTPTASSPFVTGASDYFTGVAVNPVDRSLYAYQTELRTPFGNFGSQRMEVFSASGTVESSFVPVRSSAPELAVDPAGRVYYPNEATDTVEVFDAAGTSKSSIACTGCPGGPFTEPLAAALDSAGNLYVADAGDGGRAIKFKPSAGSFVYSSVLQSGAGAIGLGVDPVSNDVFVGDFEDGKYHIVAFDSSSVQFDDFGDGLFTKPEPVVAFVGQIAVNQTTRKLYVPDALGNRVLVFDRVASIPGPTATTSAAGEIGQLEATLKASVNPQGHGLTDCHFEYLEAADFQEEGFTGATSVPCSARLGGSVNVAATAQVGGLDPATEYEYQVVVANNGGSEEGGPRAFETLPPLPPDAVTGAASTITLTSATIDGTVNPHGGPISNCHFEYTDQSSFAENGFAGAASVACLTKPSGTASKAVSAKVSGLSPGTSYRFRLLATNNSGSDEGADQAFATPAETCGSNPTLCPPVEEQQPPAPAPPAQELPAPVPPTVVKKTPKCHKGFKRKKVRGKTKCVRVKKKRH